MPSDPEAIVGALRARLRPGTTVDLEWLDQVPYAVVTSTRIQETWVNLAVSIGAPSSSSPNEIAVAIAEEEHWS